MSMPTTHQAVTATQRILDAVASELPVVNALAEGDSRLAGRISEGVKLSMLKTNKVAHLWRKVGRQVLAMHPAVVDEVAVATSDKIPGEVLRVLPYINPMVVFADPPVFSTWSAATGTKGPYNNGEESMRLLGFFTYATDVHTLLSAEQANKDDLRGSRISGDWGKAVLGPTGELKELRAVSGKRGIGIEQYFGETTDADAKYLGTVLIFEILDSLGNVTDVEFNSVTIAYNFDGTLKELVEDLMSRFVFDPIAGDIDGKKARKWMKEVLGTLVGTLFYLCSTTLEAEKVPASASRHIKSPISRKPLSLYRVGWTTGAALTRLRQQRFDLGEDDIVSHYEQDPQHRRAHFKMQPYGPYNSLRKMILVMPYWTKLDRLGEDKYNANGSAGRPQGRRTGVGHNCTEDV